MAGVYSVGSRRVSNFFFARNINLWIIIANVILFFLFYLLISLEVFNWEQVAIKPSNIVDGKAIWTFLTSMFMHGGIIHLLVNMFSLFFIGSFIQRIIGARRYLYFYLVAGIFSGLFFVLISWIMNSFGLSNDFNALAVGASGALFGVAGLMTVLTPNLPLYVMFIPIPIKAKYAIPGMLVILWLISVTADIGIGNTAHLGGLLAGLIYGFYLRKKYKNRVRMISKRFS